MLGRALTSRG